MFDGEFIEIMAGSAAGVAQDPQQVKRTR